MKNEEVIIRRYDLILNIAFAGARSCSTRCNVPPFTLHSSVVILTRNRRDGLVEHFTYKIHSKNLTDRDVLPAPV
jgi:hypothetical protein